MARVFITGSTTGLGRAAAEELLDRDHQVVLHARNRERAAAIDDLAPRADGIVIGDLASRVEVRNLADRVNSLRPMDAVIHNAAIYSAAARVVTPEGHARTLAVNLLAPYLLTAWVEQPTRLVYLSSDMHKSGDRSLRDLDWTARRWNGVQAYCDSKLFIASLAFALAQRWPDCLVNAVDPGWVPTRMGGAGAPDDLALGHRTQAWLAVSDDLDATTTGGYWYHQQRQTPARSAVDPRFQDGLLHELTSLTGTRLG